MKKTTYYRLEWSRMDGQHFVKAFGYLDNDTGMVYELRNACGGKWLATDFETGLLITNGDTMKLCAEHAKNLMDIISRKRETPEYKEQADRLYKHCLAQEAAS